MQYIRTKCAFGQNLLPRLVTIYRMKKMFVRRKKNIFILLHEQTHGFLFQKLILPVIRLPSRAHRLFWIIFYLLNKKCTILKNRREPSSYTEVMSTVQFT